MENIINVANYIYDSYKRDAKEAIDELKLQKLLYFSQRESLAITNTPLFSEELEGWRHGPVSPMVRAYYQPAMGGIMMATGKVSAEAERIVDNVLAQYGQVASWKLRDLSHEEISWKNSRIGLEPKEAGNRELSLDDIREDAKKIRPFDYTWGMYYDEFEDADEVE